MKLVDRSDIEEANVIEETGAAPEPLSDTNKLEQWLIEQFDKHTQNNKSKVVTEALILAELAQNSSKLRSLQAEHQQVLDRYFEQINYQKLIDDHGGKIKDEVSKNLGKFFKDKALPFIAGGSAGMVIAGLLNK